jgi:hypothetical protein
MIGAIAGDIIGFVYSVRPAGNNSSTAKTGQ